MITLVGRNSSHISSWITGVPKTEHVDLSELQDSGSDVAVT